MLDHIKRRKNYKILNQFIQPFIDKYIPLSESLPSKRLLKKYCLFNNFDAYVVGSDQVWRPKFSANIDRYFLSFLAEDSKALRFAYAASFGVDKWEYDDMTGQLCRDLAKKFDYISVREDSGVRLCKEHLGVDAIHNIDPTMLLHKEDYLELIPLSNKRVGNFFAYILDSNTQTDGIVDFVISNMNNVRLNRINECKLDGVRKHNRDSCSKPAIEEWLMAFRDAEFVVADSFHGCVFSIIFNKPFIAIGNETRGMARFESLLRMFGLENRLIYNCDEISQALVVEPINWFKVNYILEYERKNAMEYLGKIEVKDLELIN
jgi:polysaccharide pyruvyl transferase WcaK-like protein